VGWNDPSAVAGAHGHHSPGSVDQLVAIVKMQWDHVPSGIVMRQGDNAGAAVRETIKNRALSLCRFLDIHCHNIESTSIRQWLSWAYP
jgi:hypothetical protein